MFCYFCKAESFPAKTASCIRSQSLVDAAVYSFFEIWGKKK
jgi:hypothetical protein